MHINPDYSVVRHVYVLVHMNRNGMLVDGKQLKTALR